jgi:beta-mannosidase
MTSFVRAVSALLLCLSFASAQQIIFLKDLTWTISNGDVSVPGTWPGEVHVDLKRAGKIGEPTKGQNDINQLWVQRSNWTYTSDPITNL